MDIQVLNEIANLARQASLSKVSTSVSAHPQLKGLKGEPVPAPGSPVPPSLVEGSPEQIQVPVTPEISTVARAASAYSAAIGDELNFDELTAIQDLAGKVRTAVSEFLSQPGLEQAEDAVALVTSNPETVQDFTSNVKQVVVDTLNLPESEGELIVHTTSPNVNGPEEVTVPKDFISLERVTSGAEFNHRSPVVAASPALQNAQAGDHARVETPVSRPDAVASPQQEPAKRLEPVPVNPQDTSVTPASSTQVHSLTNENASVENPVTVGKGVETSNRDFRITPASPAIHNINAQSQGAEDAANTVTVPEPSSGNLKVIAASPALQNAQAGDRARVETPVSRPEPVPASVQETPVVAVSPALQNVQASDRARVETPVSRPETVPASVQETPVVAASPALQNAQSQNSAIVKLSSDSAPEVNQGHRPEGAQQINIEKSVASSAGASSPQVSEQSNPQPVSTPQAGSAQSSELFARENAAVKPENIRNVDELVNSVVDSEFTSEAKKIFSEPKVIRTVADLADFILERLREIIATQQQQSQTSGAIGLS
jgi:hypothetical protein